MNFGSRSDPLTGYWQALADDSWSASDKQSVLFYIETNIGYDSVKYEPVCLHDVTLTVTKKCRRVALFDDDDQVIALGLTDNYMYKRDTINVTTDWARVYA